ncbi:hypothetical protein QUF74_17345 [Candidatus Halobeggiatoa sp. HSG11]|nr:hypothetical protein [Candidatus Halobeggiatoa sp. HSG11]
MRFKYKILSTIILSVFFVISTPLFAELFDEYGECNSFNEGVKILGIERFYQVEDRMNISVHSIIDNGIYTQGDLWIIINSPNARLYMTDEPFNQFSATPKPFVKSVQFLDNEFVVLSNFIVPPGFGGDYSIYAFFTKEEANLDELFETLLSNMDSENFTLSNN